MTKPPGDIKIDPKGRMRMPADFSRALRQLEAQILSERETRGGSDQARALRPRKKRAR